MAMVANRMGHRLQQKLRALQPEALAVVF